MGRLDAKVAIISGASSGIGRVTAERFVAEGATVVGIGLDEPRTSDAAEAVGFVPVIGSVAETDVWEQALAVAEQAGGPDIAFLNAGRYGYMGPFDELPVDAVLDLATSGPTGRCVAVRAGADPFDWEFTS